MERRKFAPGQKMIEPRNALREIDEENRIGKLRTLPPDITREKLVELALIDTDPDIALPKWQKQQTRQRVSHTKEYQSISINPRTLPLESNPEVEISKGLRRWARREDIEVHPSFRRQNLLKVARQFHSWGRRTIAAIGKAPQAEEILEQLTSNGQQRLFDI